MRCRVDGALLHRRDAVLVDEVLLYLQLVAGNPGAGRHHVGELVARRDAFGTVRDAQLRRHCLLLRTERRVAAAVAVGGLLEPRQFGGARRLGAAREPVQ